jgi:hypothetical protein
VAATLTPDSELTYYSFPISKTEEAGDGSGDLIVWGKASDGTLDSDLQIVDPVWSAKALQEWYDTGGNVRVQHQAQRDPAGRGIDIRATADGTFVRTRVVEPVAVKLVKAGVLQDYSVGIMNPDVRRGDPQFKHLDPMGKAVNGVITGRDDGMSKIGELSLVDRGSNFGTKFQLVKAAADGTPEWACQLTAPDDVLASVAGPKNGKTVTVELPRDMPVTMRARDVARLGHGPNPKDLAKLETLGKRLAQQAADPAPRDMITKTAGPDVAKAVTLDGDGLLTDDALKAVGAAEDAILGKDARTFSTGERRGYAREQVALADGSYPMPDADAVRRAAILIRSKHGKWKAAAKLLAKRVAALGIPNPLKGKKADKIAGAQVTKCKCAGGMMDGKPCPDCKKGRKAAKRAIRKALAPHPVAKKRKMVCPGCGAMQSRKHAMCTECGSTMAGAAPVTKNHDHMCLGCSKTLDKGEKFCPGCGRENPGYLPVADHKIPMNDKAAKPGKERADGDEKAPAGKKGKRGKKKAGKKGNPFGGNQAKPFGARDDDGKPAKAEKRKGKGKGRKPTAGVTGEQPSAPLPAHREPDGAPIEMFERDTGLQDGDESSEMDAAMRHKAFADRGLSQADALLHDLTCPAFAPAEVSKAFPSATFAGIDDAPWRQNMLDDAASAPLEQAGQAMAMWQHAVTLKSADPQLLADLRAEDHAAFLRANKDTLPGALKAFRDATPGPGTAPTPAHVSPQEFRRPYIHEGHAAPSPLAAPPHSFAVPGGQPSAADYHRPLITAGHATDSPDNDTPRHEPQPAPMTPGKPSRVYYRDTMRDNARQAMTAMHDHISRVFPDVCPMSPEITGAQKPAPQVPEGVGGPAPHSAKALKAAKAARKAARVQAARQRRKLERRVLAGTISVTKARKRLGLPAQKAAGPAAAKAAGAAPALDTDVLKAAIAEATAPLLRRAAKQDKAIRKQRKALGAIASQADTSAAPFRGVALAPKTSAPPAGALTAAATVELAKAAELNRLRDAWRNSSDPKEREAAYSGLLDQLGLTPVNPMT